MKKHINKTVLFKKILVFVTTFSIMFSSSALTSYADVSTGYVSVKEFETTMNEIYSENGSSFKVTDDNGVQYISIEHAEEMYQTAIKAFEDKRAKQLAQVELANNFDASISQIGTGISPLVMPISYYRTEKYVVNGASVPLAYATFKFNLSGTVNAQYNSFMSLDYSGVYANGPAVNYDGYNIISERKSFTSNNTKVNIVCTMDVYFSWTDTAIGIKFSETIRDIYANTFSAVE